MQNKRVFKILLRSQAVSFALLYLFLCTFGVLTHGHALPEVDLDNATFTASECVAETAHTTLHHHKVTSEGHCGFCEWQASSVGTILTNPLLSLLNLVSIETTAPIVSTHSQTFTHASTRAPPIA